MAVNQVQEWEIVIDLEEGQRQALESWDDFFQNITMFYQINDSELVITGFDSEYTAELYNYSIVEFLASL